MGAAPRDMEIYGAQTDDLLASQHRDPLLRHLTKVIVGHVKAQAPAGARVLDVGCGVGRTSLALARHGFEVTGVDPSPRAIELASAAAAQRGLDDRAKFLVGDATVALPAERADTFAAVVCSEVLEHVADPAAVLAYCRAALRPSGVLVLTTPHDRRQWTAMDDYAGHVTRFDVGELTDLLSVGFRVGRVETEGFPFQRAIMKMYDAGLQREGRRHEFGAIRDTMSYRAYVAVMPALLAFDHLLRRLCRGTTIVAIARRRE